MKRWLAMLLAVVLLLTASVVFVYAADALYGDVNNDGKINNRDLGLLQQYLNEYDVTIHAMLADVNDDGRINNRDLGLLQQYLNEWDVTLGPDEPGNPGGSEDPPVNPPVNPPVDPPDDPPVDPDVPAAALPEVGYDFDDRGRILVKEISQRGYVVTVVVENTSDKWMTEETSCVEYTCTDAEGNVLYLDNKYYGTLYFGMLESNQVRTYTITLPEGTAKLEFGDYRIIYWSQWA